MYRHRRNHLTPVGDRQVVLIPRLQLITAAILFSTGGAAIKLTHLPGAQIACLRSSIAALALYAIFPEARRHWTRLTLVSGCAYGAALLFFVLATKLTSVANAIFLQAGAPLYVLLLSPWILKERLQRSDFVVISVLTAGLLLAFAGQPAESSSTPNPLIYDQLKPSSVDRKTYVGFAK